MGMMVYNSTTGKLQINPTEGVNAFEPIATTNTYNNTYWTLLGNAGSNSSTNFLGTTDNVNLTIRTNNLTRATFTNDGKLGIGTTSPSSTFEAYHSYSGTSNVTNIISNLSIGGASGNATGMEYRTTNTGTKDSLIMVKVGDLNNTSGTITGFTAGLHIGNLTSGTQTNPAYSLYSSDTSAYSYFGGNVGIGTDEPEAKLHIVVSDSNSAILKFESNAAKTKGLMPVFDASGKATMKTMSSVFFPIKTVTADYTITDGDYVVVGDVSGGPFTIILPIASTNKGRTIVITRVDDEFSTSRLTVEGNGSDGAYIRRYMNNATTFGLGTPGSPDTGASTTLTVCSDGVSWFVVSAY